MNCVKLPKKIYSF